MENYHKYHTKQKLIEFKICYLNKNAYLHYLKNIKMQ